MHYHKTDLIPPTRKLCLCQGVIRAMLRLNTNSLSNASFAKPTFYENISYLLKIYFLLSFL